MILLIVGGIVVTIVIATVLFLNLNPEFGGNISDTKKDEYAKLSNYNDSKFINQIKTSLDMSLSETVSVMIDFIKGGQNRTPEKPIDVHTIDSLDLNQNPEAKPKITWFGHSTVLIQIDGKNILIDPMFSQVPSPVPFMGTKRYSSTLPIEIEKLPFIDIVLISHDHFDHLDYQSIKRLKDKVGMFLTPLGVSTHLLSWKIDSSKVRELNWWDETEHEDILFGCTPARHFSGRGILNRNSTLWASWVIKTKSKTIFFSGDSGYGPHFKEIGAKYGPFDFAFLECGQYDSKWEAIHMMPEQTVQAAQDLDAQLMMPIHWGAFTLALHSWKDPIERVTQEAARVGKQITTPQIGEPIYLNNDDYPISSWWERYK